MQFTNTLLSAFMLVAAATAQSSSNVTVHVIQVGVNNTLTFSPDSIQANPGEIVQFQFLSKNHSVVQSAFSDPCDPISAVTPNVTGFNSGFMPVKDDVPVFSIVVNDTKPIWGHCSQIGHCPKGMVFAINAPTSGNKTFDAFQALALATGNTTDSTSTGSASTTGSSTSASGTGSSASSSASAAGSTSASSPSITGNGMKQIVDMTLLMLLGVSGVLFIGL